MNLWNQYFEDCTVPSHPTSCPKCSEKVGRYQINLDEAMFMCSNKNCPWPFDSVYKSAEISGKSDINKLVKAMKLGGETDSDRDGLKEPYFHKGQLISKCLFEKIVGNYIKFLFISGCSWVHHSGIYGWSCVLQTVSAKKQEQDDHLQ